ncbi:hyaluronate lyase N-terminal domain-containing protein [Rhizobium rhizogenes]|uniref:hyaluronate lyase N-terminal domain-containing protein n=1 Tax=Rhizobium rhizogenes TaxID=359 RepID=UPI00191D5888|nr:hypothetical protein [Rhizobium rhizogenes]
MSTEVRFRRGTAAQHAAFTGALAEVTVDTDKKALHVHDGSTAGGNRTLMLSELGAANGVADLDSSGNVPASRLGSVTAIAATRAALKALDTTKITTAYLRESGREGQFLWQTGDFSSQIAADTQEGLYVKATAVAATSGAWVRVYQGDISVKWFGAVGDGVAADSVAVQAAVDMCGFLGGGHVLLPRGNFKIGTAITISKNFVKVRGTGLFSTQVTPSTAGMDAFIFYSGGAAEMKNNGISDLVILPSVSINRAVLVRNHYQFLGQNVSVWGTHATAFEFENGTVAYNAVLRDCVSDSATTAGVLLGGNGTGDLQNVFLYDCFFSGGGVGVGVLARNCGGLQWVGGESLNKDTCFRIAPNVSGKRVNGIRVSNIFFDTPVFSCLNINVAVGTRVSDAIFVNCHFNNSQNESGILIGGLSSDASLIDTLKFVGCNVVINKKYGFYGSYCQKIDLLGCSFISNGVDGTSHGISLATGVSFVNIIGGLSGAGDGFGVTQRYGVEIISGVTNVVIDGMMLTGNATGPVSDSGTGTVITNCSGCKTFANGASSIANAGTSVTVTHGLGFTPAKEDITIRPVTDTGGPRYWVSATTSTTFTVTFSSAATAQWFFGWQVGVRGN